MKLKTMVELSGLSADTLRYYEKAGLIDFVLRDSSGNRCYTMEDLSRVEFIKCLKKTGLTLEEILGYIQMYRKGDETLDERLQILELQKDKVNQLIIEYQCVKGTLENKIQVYKENILNRKM